MRVRCSVDTQDIVTVLLQIIPIMLKMIEVILNFDHSDQLTVFVDNNVNLTAPFRRNNPFSF